LLSNLDTSVIVINKTL